MFRSAWSYQEQALVFALDRRRVALFMEMRLGKSLVAIRWANRSHPLARVLIVAPLTTLPGWEQELEEEYEGPRTFSLRDPKVRVWEVGFYLVNYEHVRSNPSLLEEPWDVIILDESTRIKNPKAIITRTLLKHTEHIPYRMILSGEPAPESQLDYFTQMQFLHGRWMGCSNYWQFRHQFFEPVGYEWFPKKGTRGSVKTLLEKDSFSLTRKQAGVGSRKVRERRWVEMTREQRRAYRSIEKEFAVGELSTKWEMVRVNWMSRVAGGVNPETGTVEWTGKANELVALLQGELTRQPVIVWFRYNAELRYIKRRLREAGISYGEITGRTTLEDRASRLKRFRSGRFRVFLIQLKCGKFGLDLAKADTAIYYSNSWSYEDRSQSEDRIISAKKKTPVLYLDLVTRSTVDENAVEALRSKRTEARSMRSQLLLELRKRYGKE